MRREKKKKKKREKGRITKMEIHSKNEFEDETRRTTMNVIERLVNPTLPLRGWNNSILDLIKGIN